MSAPPIRMMLAGGVIALVLALILVPGLKAANPRDADVLMQLLGGTAGLASEKAYGEADLYFHAGVSGRCSHCNHYNPNLVESRPKVHLPLSGMIERLHGLTTPKSPRHLKGADEKELLPWFMAAVRLNSHNVEAWCTGSYWFYRTSDCARAEEFISDGIRHNPKDYRVYLERGIFYHRFDKWDKAISDLETARQLWKNNSEDAPFDLKAICVYLEDCRNRLEGN